ncbi:DDE superfamily endonuclease [Streptomyces sp. SLBN-115]|nr:DDE superfamily endonuclease [Streptomyces sp. SLBN-115]
MSLPHLDVPGEAFAEASCFRDDFFDCLTARGDELFELADALLCADGPVTSLVDLTLVAEHRRGHGAMYEALNHGNVDVPRLRQVLAGLPMPRAADGRLVLAVDVSNWLRPDAPTSADRLFCHVYGRSGRSSDQFIPGWPYSFVAALESGGRPGASCWTLSVSGPRTTSPRSPPLDATTTRVTDRYGTARAMAWDRIHPRLTTRSAWIDHTGELPIIEGTLIRLRVDRRLWSSATGLNSEDVDVHWQAFLRRFDIEHLFRLMKQTLGWTRPKLRTPEAGERWTWLIIAAHTQIRLLREAASTCGGRGRSPPSLAGSPRPASAGGFGTSARTCTVRLVHRNPQLPDLKCHLARRTSGPPPATTWARP